MEFNSKNTIVKRFTGCGLSNKVDDRRKLPIDYKSDELPYPISHRVDITIDINECWKRRSICRIKINSGIN